MVCWGVGQLLVMDGQGGWGCRWKIINTPTISIMTLTPTDWASSDQNPARKDWKCKISTQVNVHILETEQTVKIVTDQYLNPNPSPNIEAHMHNKTLLIKDTQSNLSFPHPPNP